MISPKKQRFFICDFETTGITDNDHPIEVGIIVCDEDFNFLDSYSSLIAPPDDCFGTNDIGVKHWSPRYVDAYKVHRIEPEKFSSFNDANIVRQSVQSLVRLNTVDGRKPILVSDNIQFEWMHMKKLLGRDDWPFHYCGWDTSLFLEATGIGDPRNVPHRALADCGRLYKAIIEALYKTSSLRE